MVGQVVAGRILGKHYGWLLLAAAGVLLFLAVSADANHYRGGTIYTDAQPNVDPLAVRIQGTLYFKITWDGWLANGALCGSPIQPAPGLSVSGCVLSINGGGFDFGDGSITTSFTGRVDVYDVTDDWFSVILVGSDGQDGLPHTYASATDPFTFQPWLVRYDSGARFDNDNIDHHVNNGLSNYRLETNVLLGPTDRPPVLFSTGSLLPVVYCAPNALCRIPVAAADADNEPYTVRFADDSNPPCEATPNSGSYPCQFYEPGPCPACGAGLFDSYIIGTTMYWDTTNAFIDPAPTRTFYTAHVVMEDSRGAKTPVEFMISLSPPRTPQPPTADFYWDPFMCGPHTITFHDVSKAGSSGNLIRHTWTWGDGNVDPYTDWQDTRYHPYLATGTYIVNVEEFQSDGTSTISADKQLIIPACPPPQATFYPDPYPCSLPRTITFHDTSTPAPGHPIVQSEWDFGDGSAVATFSPPVPSVTHSYTAPTGAGLIRVRLRVQDNTTTWSNVAIRPLSQCPAPGFTPLSDPNGCPEYAVHFADGSSDPDGNVAYWAWNFGDGFGSTERNPIHAYEKAGTYRVTLKVTDNTADNATLVKSVTARGYEECPVDPNRPMAKDPADGTPRDSGNKSSSDPDKDGLPSSRDNCDAVFNPDQADADKDGVGDACDGDKDGDGVLNSLDNCPLAANLKQTDSDGDGVGDACAGDADGDGIPDSVDDCIVASNPAQADMDHDGIGDACDLDVDGDGVSNAVDLYPLDGSQTLLRDDAQAGQRQASLAGVSTAAVLRTPWIVGGLAALLLLGAVLVVVGRRRR